MLSYAERTILRKIGVTGGRAFAAVFFAFVQSIPYSIAKNRE